MEKMISIVVPVYNASEYLEPCLQSLALQSDENYEVILVDDGSTDHSFNICEEFIRTHSNFKLIHKENGGVSSARNLGIKNSKGYYLSFVDSDDYVGTNYLADLRNAMKDNIDFVLSKFYFVDGEIITAPKSISITGGIKILFDKDTIIACQAPYAKLFKREIVIKNAISFDEKVRYGEDRLFVYSYLLAVNNVAISPYCNYYYIRRPGSLTSKIYSIETEYYAYRESKQLIDKIVDSLKLTESDSLRNLYAEVCDYGNRVINAIYHTGGLSRKERLSRMKIINMDFHSRYLRADTLKEKFLRVLLRWRFYCLYDLIRVIKLSIN